MQASYPVTNLTYVVSQAANASFNAPQVPKEPYSGVFVQAVLAGATSPVGTLTFQVSADSVSWSTLSVQGTAQTIAVSANGTYNFNIPMVLASRFWRLAWTYTSGTAGTFNFMYNMT